jgi:hypothetical protein
MKFREARGSLEESMKTVVMLADGEELAKYVGSLIWKPWLEPGDFIVTYQGFDGRIGWESYLVVLPRYGVVGYIDGPLIG